MPEKFRRLFRSALLWMVLILIFAYGADAGETWSARKVALCIVVAMVLGTVIAMLLQLLAYALRGKNAVQGTVPPRKPITPKDRVIDFFVTATYLTLLNHYCFSSKLFINRDLPTCILVSSAAAVVLALFRDKLKLWVKRLV